MATFNIRLDTRNKLKDDKIIRKFISLEIEIEELFEFDKNQLR